MAGDGRNESVSLSAYLGSIGRAISEVPSAWVRCELQSISIRPNWVKLDFVEVDASGSQLASAHSGCFTDVWERIQTQFQQAGVSLVAGQKVLVRLSPRLHANYGFSFKVEDIDASFTLGDINIRLAAIRRRLTDEGYWGKNKSLPHPRDYVRVAVISPISAAGLGDFRSTMDPLVEAGLASVVYYEAPFQSREAPARILDALRQVWRACRNEETAYCAVCIIRGGGASSDFNWLVDYDLAKAICIMPIPVLVGIGHERDRTMLDEVACIPCDTPSKVAELIKVNVCRSAEAAARASEQILNQLQQTLSQAMALLDATRHDIQISGVQQLNEADEAIRGAGEALRPEARKLLDASDRQVTTLRGKVTNLASEKLFEGREEVRSLFFEVRASGSSLHLKGREEVRLLLSGVHASGSSLLQSVTSLLRASTDEIMLSAASAKAVAGTAITELREEVSWNVEMMLSDASRNIASVRVLAEASDPLNVLARGFSILRSDVGQPLTSVAALETSSEVVAQMRDGSVRLSQNLH